MQYLGNGQYQIKNKKTGQTKVVAEQELSSYGLKPETSQIGLEKTGLYDIPVLGGLSRLLTEPVEKTVRTIGGAGYEAVRGVQSAMGDKNAYVNQDTGVVKQNPFITMQEMERIQKEPGLEAVKAAAGPLSYTVPGGGFVGGITGRGAAGAAFLNSLSQSKGGPVESFKNAAVAAPIGAIAGPALSKATKLITSIPGAISRHVTEALPESIKVSADIQERKVANLVSEKMGTLVGTNNIKKATDLGITENTPIEDVVNILRFTKDQLGETLNNLRSGKYINLGDIERKLSYFSKNGSESTKTLIKDFIKKAEDIDVNISKGKTEQLFEKGKLKLDQAPIGTVTETIPAGPGRATTVLPKTENPVMVKGKPVLNAAGEPMIEPGPIVNKNINSSMNVQSGEQVSTGLPKTVAQRPNVISGPGPNDKPSISLDTLEEYRQEVFSAWKQTVTEFNRAGDRSLQKLHETISGLIKDNSGKGGGASRQMTEDAYREYRVVKDMFDTANKEFTSSPASKNITEFLAKKQGLEQTALPGTSQDIFSAGAAGVGAMALGPIGALPSGAYWIYRILQGALKNPKNSKALAAFLSSKAIDPNSLVIKLGEMSKEGVIKALEQIGIRGAAKLVK